MIILLDLNYTLVSNSSVKIKPFSDQIMQENYRLDLINLVKSHTVLMLTARPAIHKEQTIATIKAKTGWEPDRSWFNSYMIAPPLAKERMLKDSVFPAYGSNGNDFFAVESNPQTRAMYKKYGINSCRYEDLISNPELINGNS